MRFVTLLLVAVFAAFPSFADTPHFAGIAFGTSGAETLDLAQSADAAHIRRDLTQLQPLTRDIRIYSVMQNYARVPAIAERLGFHVTLGIWIGHDARDNAQEIARAANVIHAHPKVVRRVIVGNELMLQGMKADEVVQQIARARKAVGPGVPIGTAEIWSVWLAQPKLAAASDFIAVHILPYWDSVPADVAAAYVFERLDQVARAYPNKPIVIAETGWPTAGRTRGAAVPSVANQQHFIAQFTRLAAARHVPYFMFEAYDQPWKAKTSSAGWPEPLWGLFDVNGAPKVRVQTVEASPAEIAGRAQKVPEAGLEQVR